MWDGYLDFYLTLDRRGSEAWWAQHNEHRILLARLLFWVDLRFLHGNGVLLIAVNCFLAVLVCWLFYRILRERSDPQVRFVTFFAVALLTSWSQRENLGWGFQSQFLLAQLLPLAALYLQHISESACETAVSRTAFAASVACGVLALGSMANGVLVLPLLLLVGLYGGWRRRSNLMLLAGALVGPWLYFRDYLPPAQHGSLAHALAQAPGTVFLYFLAYLGGPLYAMSGKRIGTILAIAGGATFLCLTVLAIVRSTRQSEDTLGRALLAFVIFVIAGGAATAGSRYVFGFSQAFDSRYTTPTLMGWVALLAFHLPELARRHAPRRIAWALLIVLALLLPEQLKVLKIGNDDDARLAALGLSVGAFDPVQLEKVHPSPERVRAVAEAAMLRNASIFGQEPFRDIRGVLNGTIPPDAGAQCQVRVEAVTRLAADPEHVRVAARITGAEPGELVFLTQDSVVRAVLLSKKERHMLDFKRMASAPQAEGYGVASGNLDSRHPFDGSCYRAGGGRS